MSDERPWVLVRAGLAPVYFATLGEAQRVHDMQRHNGAAQSDATVFGPGGAKWQCGRWRSSGWVEIAPAYRAGAGNAPR